MSSLLKTKEKMFTKFLNEIHAYKFSQGTNFCFVLPSGGWAQLRLAIRGKYLAKILAKACWPFLECFVNMSQEIK